MEKTIILRSKMFKKTCFLEYFLSPLVGISLFLFFRFFSTIDSQWDFDQNRSLFKEKNVFCSKMAKSDDFEEFPIEIRKFELFQNGNKKLKRFPPVFCITSKLYFILPTLSTTSNIFLEIIDQIPLPTDVLTFSAYIKAISNLM